MTEQCGHVDGQGGRCLLERGHEQEIGRPAWTSQPEHRFAPIPEPTPAEIARRVEMVEYRDWQRRYCTDCLASEVHLGDCAIYRRKLEDLLNKAVNHREAVKKAHAAYVKENPSRPEIRKLLDRRAAHIRDLQAAGTRRNQEIEHLTRELEKERSRVNASPAGTLAADRLKQINELEREVERLTRLVAASARMAQIERLEAENFVFSNEVEKLGKRINILELEKRVLEDEKGVLNQALETYVADFEETQNVYSEKDRISQRRIRDLEQAAGRERETARELEQATRTVGRLQEELAAQNSWDMREADESSLLEELQRRARQRETQ